MKNNKCHLQLGATVDFKNRMMEATKGIDRRDMKRTTKDFSFLQLVILK